MTSIMNLPTWLRPQPWIPVGVVVVLMMIVPLSTWLIRLVWAAGLRKMPLDQQRGLRRIDTVLSFGRSVAYFTLAIVLAFSALHAVYPQFNPLAATGALSIVALILTGMFKDIVIDVVKGLDILFGAHFDVGDFVEFADTSGHVVDFQLKYTKLRAASGEEIVLNNAKCIPSKRFRHGSVTNHVNIPLTSPADESTAKEALHRVNVELNCQVEAVQDCPVLEETLPRPTTGGVVLRYRVNLLPGAKWVMDDVYVPLILETLKSAGILLAGEVSYFHMNDIDTFRGLFHRSLTQKEIELWAQRQSSAES